MALWAAPPGRAGQATLCEMKDTPPPHRPAADRTPHCRQADALTPICLSGLDWDGGVERDSGAEEHERVETSQERTSRRPSARLWSGG